MKSLLAVALVATGAILHEKPLPIFSSYWPGWMRLEVGIKEGFLEEERVEMEFLMLEQVYSVEAFVAGWQVFAGYPLNGLGLSKLGYQFIADILKHCPASSAAFAPTGHQLQTRCAPRARGQLFADTRLQFLQTQQPHQLGSRPNWFGGGCHLTSEREFDRHARFF